MMNNNNLTTLGEGISRFLDKSGMEPQIVKHRIRRDWAVLMGEMIARHTTAIHYEKHTLTVFIDNSVLKNELYYGKEKIKELINKHYAKEYVTEVMIK